MEAMARAEELGDFVQFVLEFGHGNGSTELLRAAVRAASLARELLRSSG